MQPQAGLVIELIILLLTVGIAEDLLAYYNNYNTFCIICCFVKEFVFLRGPLVSCIESSPQCLNRYSAFNPHMLLIKLIYFFPFSLIPLRSQWYLSYSTQIITSSTFNAITIEPSCVHLLEFHIETIISSRYYELAENLSLFLFSDTKLYLKIESLQIKLHRVSGQTCVAY